ncbi:hypothetical protein [Laspinema olomoucense]|uniref:hypothetical protein n=1 Tax=Laspinema olomoucense TaxID=3231600 RepID=UPI0021BAE492|nr:MULTISPECIES: hypothetical protein [unclassified Laspinema]MCT7973932.1 hypothetical protein [Laspinema sp. D3d]MCT7994053.1 hypothetical protein [Laspinema sp. D3c]
MNTLKLSLPKPKTQISLTLLSLLLLLPGLNSCTIPGKNSTPTIPEAEKDLPEQRFLEFPGWLGFGTKVQQDGVSKFPFSPTSGESQIAMFSEQWSLVDPGTPLVAIAPGIREEVTLRRWQNEPYGCDNSPTPMATFNASQTFPEGAVWVVPPSQGDAATALTVETLPLERIPEGVLRRDPPDAKQIRAWEAGETIIVLEQTGEKTAMLTVADNAGTALYTNPVEILSIPGSYEKPIDFSQRFQPGIPQPIGAFQFQNNAVPLLVFWRSSFEGHSFEAVVPRPDRLESVDLGSVYYCAF